jgi:hypothetical protein
MSIKDRIYFSSVNANAALRKTRYNGKVFCIGFNKTGTTSLGKSLEILGYRNTSFNPKVWQQYKNGEIDKVLKYTAKFDSCDDLPWLRIDMIPLLDEKFPGSKFIYLKREENSWKKSYKNWRKKVFGKEPDVEEGYKAYQEHEAFVLDYFKDRIKKDLIILDIKDPQGFKKLADFLGKETNLEAFPHFNKT